MHRLPPLAVLTSCLALLAATMPAQRGGRGRPEAILERVSCYLVTEKLPPAAAGADRLASVGLVAGAKAKQELVLLYLFDSGAEAPKRETFETVMFGNEELGVALRCFHFARLDIAGDAELGTRYGKRLPTFVAFDANGRNVGDVSFTGYRAAIGPLITLLEKASAGHVKPSLGVFTSEYRKVVHDFEMFEARRKTLGDRQEKASDPAKKTAIDKDLAELDAEQKKAAAAETRLLEQAKVPVRDAQAKRFEVRRGR